MYFEVADVINIISMFLNIAILIMVAIFYQNIQVNSRTLKDYYINEFNLRLKELVIFIIDVEEGAIYPKITRNKFFNHISTFNNLSSALIEQYDININGMIVHILAMQGQVEDDPNFSINFDQNLLTSLNIEVVEFIRNKRTDQLEKDLYHTINLINNKKNNVFTSLVQ